MFNKYDAYKDSGVEWIGEIPISWSIEKAKWIFSRAERPVRKEDEIVTCFRDGEVTLRSNRRTEGFTNALKEHGYQGIRKGDLVIHAMDAFAGAIGVSDSDGKSTPVYSACIPRIKNRVNVYYYSYYLRNLALAGFIESLAKGIRERSTDFRFSDFAELLLPFPALDDQNQIVEFLNQKTSEIDQAIAIKEQQIALLNERKQIVIQKAVTQGLNPNVAMKDSGVEWIGGIPEHWNLLKLKNLALVNPINTTLVNNLDKKASVCFLAMESVETNGTVDYSHTRELASVRSGFTSFVKGDVLVAKITPCFENGKGAYLDALQTPIGFGSTEFHVLRVKKNCDPKFLYYVTKSHSFMDMGEGLMIGSAGQKRVPTSFMQNYVVAIPDIATQIEIVNFIDQRLGEIAEAIDLQKKQIEKLKEYKTTLINDAVTGKIKMA